jgi:hypothetical protein
MQIILLLVGKNADIVTVVNRIWQIVEVEQLLKTSFLPQTNNFVFVIPNFVDP